MKRHELKPGAVYASSPPRYMRVYIVLVNDVTTWVSLKLEDEYTEKDIIRVKRADPDWKREMDHEFEILHL